MKRTELAERFYSFLEKACEQKSRSEYSTIANEIMGHILPLQNDSLEAAVSAPLQNIPAEEIEGFQISYTNC